MTAQRLTLAPIGGAKPHIEAGHTIRLNRQYDAYYCVQCNEWLEKPCGDPDCDFCRDRPANPL